MKQALVTMLWAFSFWYLGSAVALYAGISDLLGPILGLAAGVLIVVDPHHAMRPRVHSRA